MGRNRPPQNSFASKSIADNLASTDYRIDMYSVETPNSLIGGLTIGLDPNALDGDQVIIADGAGNAAAHPITITGDSINGVGTSTEIASNGGGCQFIRKVYADGSKTWVCVALSPTSLANSLGRYISPSNTGTVTSTPIATALVYNVGNTLTARASGKFSADMWFFGVLVAGATLASEVFVQAGVHGGPLADVTGGLPVPGANSGGVASNTETLWRWSGVITNPNGGQPFAIGTVVDFNMLISAAGSSIIVGVGLSGGIITELPD